MLVWWWHFTISNIIISFGHPTKPMRLQLFCITIRQLLDPRLIEESGPHSLACLWWTYIPCQSVTVQVNSSHTKRTPNARHKRNLTHFHKDPYIRSFSNRLLCLNCALSRLIQGAEYPRHDSYSQLTISCQKKRCDRTCQKGNWLQQKLTPWLTYTQKNSVNINDSCAKQNTQVGMCIIKIIKWSI